MNSIMWTQSENHGGDDYYFVDSKLIPVAEGTKRKEAINKILKAQETRENFSSFNKKKREETGYPYFTLAGNPLSGFVYKSLFNEFSESGRQRGFVFWCSYSEMSKALEYLNYCAGQLGYSLRKDEIPVVQNFINSVKNRYRKISIFCLICIVILIVILCLL